jgi:hypothetical protein
MAVLIVSTSVLLDEFKRFQQTSPQEMVADWFPWGQSNPRTRDASMPVALFRNGERVKWQLGGYRNIAANPYDLRGAVATFPHATASRESDNVTVRTD